LKELYRYSSEKNLFNIIHSTPTIELRKLDSGSTIEGQAEARFTNSVVNPEIDRLYVTNMKISKHKIEDIANARGFIKIQYDYQTMNDYEEVATQDSSSSHRYIDGVKCKQRLYEYLKNDS
ncbi:unnamed protein product, partial [Didymodactylos carnosus]